MRIAGVRFIRFKGQWRYDGPLGEDRGSSPLDIYPDLRERRRRARTWPIPNLDHGSPYPLQVIYLFIDSDEGVSGMTGVSEEAARIVASQLMPLLIGEHPFAIERVWDRMYRSAAVTGRKGPTISAISAVDVALWDLKGKLLGVPVYQLLGGPTRDKVRAYASMLGYSVEPEMAAQRSKEMAAQRSKEMIEQGYTAIKWFFKYGPGDGPDGMRRNLGLIRAVREAVGPDVDIMFDAWKSWTVPYTVRMAEMAAKYRPWWFEEPVMPDQIPQYTEIRRRVGNWVAISGGEHEYTRWGMKALLDAEAVDILQPDPHCGGISELVKICAMASTEAIPVIPHHGAMAALHLIASQSPAVCPIQEWILQAGRRSNLFVKPKIEPVHGHFDLPTGPGLGLELDEETIDSRDEITP
jgi:L-alanine-DL-glutamate epimerase-like enolase superfamily enzyme